MLIIFDLLIHFIIYILFPNQNLCYNILSLEGKYLMNQVRKNLSLIFILCIITFILQLLSLTANAEPFFSADIQNKLSDAIVIYKDKPHAYVNNREIYIDPNDRHVTPENIGGRILLPVKFFTENLGASLVLEKSTQNIFIGYGKNKIRMRINDSIIEINGKQSEMDFPACIMHKRIYIPLNTACKAFGKKLLYYKGLVIISNKSDIFNTVDDKSSLEKIIAFFNENHDVFIPILMYHNFNYNITDALLPTTITPLEFEQQIKYLTANGCKGITFSELYDYAQGKIKLPQKPFIITMDDGYYSNYQYAYPILKKYNTPGTIFTITSFMGQHPSRNPHFTWEEAREMENSGFIEIQNHSSYHGRHDQMPYNELVKSVMDAQKMLDDELGEREVKVFAYPGGRCSEYTRKVLKALGFKIQITELNGIASRYSDLSNLKRINIQHGMTGRDIINRIEIQKAAKALTKFVNIDY